MLPANDYVQHDVANIGSHHMLPASSCHDSFGGGQPMPPANYAQHDVTNVASGYHVPPGGSQPMLSANCGHHGYAQHDAQPYGCTLPVVCSQPMLHANHAQPGVQMQFGSNPIQIANPAQHDAQPYSCNMPVGGSQPILHANYEHHDVESQPMHLANYVQQGAQPHGCHLPSGGSQPMLFPNHAQPDVEMHFGSQAMFPALSAQHDDHLQVGSQPTMQLASHAQHGHQLQIGSHPMLPPSHAQPDVLLASNAQHDAQQHHGCHVPSGGSQPMFSPNHSQHEFEMHFGSQPMLPATNVQHDDQLQFGSQPMLPPTHVQPDVQMHFGSQPMVPASNAQHDHLQVGSQPTMQLASHVQTNGFGCVAQTTVPAEDQHVPHVHWQSDMGHPGPIEHLVQPHGWFADSNNASSGSNQPMFFANHAQPHHGHHVDAQPSIAVNTATQVFEQAASSFVPPNAHMPFAPSSPSVREGFRSMQDLPGTSDLVPVVPAGNQALAQPQAPTSNTNVVAPKSRPHALVRAPTQEELPEKIAVVQLDAGTTLTATVSQDGDTAEWEWARAVSFMGMKTNKHHLYLSRNKDNFKAELEVAEVV